MITAGIAFADSNLAAGGNFLKVPDWGAPHAS